MAHNDKAVPPELLQLSLSQEQLAGVKRYIGLQVDLARRQRRIIVALCMVIATALVFGQIVTGNAALPFDTVVQVIFRYIAFAAAGISVIGIGLLQLSAHRLSTRLGEFGRDYGMSDAQCAGVREIGHTVSMVVIFGPLYLLFGRKNNNL